jgi:uncharacterized protein DUF3846
MSSKRKVHTLTTISPDGGIKSEQLPDTLDNLQERVGGMIERVPDWKTYQDRRCTVYCNENGIAEGLSYNYLATALWREYLTRYCERTGGSFDPGMATLIGPVVIVTRAAE